MSDLFNDDEGQTECAPVGPWGIVPSWFLWKRPRPSARAVQVVALITAHRVVVSDDDLADLAGLSDAELAAVFTELEAVGIMKDGAITLCP